MDKQHHNLNELDILAYADGQLEHDQRGRAEVEARLRASPELATRLRAYRAQTEALRAAYGGRIHEPIPERLLATIERTPPRHGRYLLRAAAMLLLAVFAGATGWLLGRSERAAEWTVEAFLERSYQEYQRADTGADIDAAAYTQPLSQLSEEIALTLHAPDLGALGYSLIDKHTVRDADSQIVRLTYAAEDGRNFSLFLRPRWGERQRELKMATQKDVSLAYWLDGPLISAIASRLPPEETLAIAKTVRSALRDPDTTRPTIEPAPPLRLRQGGDLITGLPAAQQDLQRAGESPIPRLPAAGTLR